MVKLQERLGYNTNWKEICNVEYTDSRVIHNPYMSTVPSLQSHTRGTPYTYQVFTLTDEYVTINQSEILAIPIDRADLAQCDFVKQMDLADLQGTLIQEYLETDMLANYAMWTAFDNGSLTTGTSDSVAITVDTSNILTIIGKIKTAIRKANGGQLAARNGIFFLWRPADFEILETVASANGWSTADNALKNGIEAGFRYKGCEHYMSNLHTAGHLFAGVKGIFHLGVLKSTYGDVQVVNEPATTDGALSGVGVISRIDWEYKAWTNTAGLLFNIVVN